ncbi:MAG: TlpA disulfide reductase family protein [Isosphaeraceae bacterium]
MARQRETMFVMGAFLIILCGPTGRVGADDAKSDQAKKAGEAARNVDASVESIDEDFTRQLLKLERDRMERLGKLAATKTGDEANQVYAAYFGAAIANELYTEAEPTALKVTKSPDVSPDVALQAYLVKIVAEAERGALSDSHESLLAAIKRRNGNEALAAMPLASRLMLLDAYLQRLEQTGQFDRARKTLREVQQNAMEPAVKDLASNRLTQLELVDKPAPPIAGKGLDGKAISLNDFKGDAVLVIFWASWYAPAPQELEVFRQTIDAHRKNGLRVLGVNVDRLQDGGQPLEQVLPNIKRFLIDHNIPWPSVIDEPGDKTIAGSYGVTEVPSNFLIARDGKIVQLDMTRANLNKVITKALAK